MELNKSPCHTPRSVKKTSPKSLPKSHLSSGNSTREIQTDSLGTILTTTNTSKALLREEKWISGSTRAFSPSVSKSPSTNSPTSKGTSSPWGSSWTIPIFSTTIPCWTALRRIWLSNHLSSSPKRTTHWWKSSSMERAPRNSCFCFPWISASRTASWRRECWKVRL